MFGLKEKINLNPSSLFATVLNFKDYLVKECLDMQVKLKDIPGTNYELGLRHLVRGNLSDAIMRFKLVIKLRENDPKAYYYLAQALTMNGRADEAIKYIKIALFLKPDWVEAKYIENKASRPESLGVVPDQVVRDRIVWQYEKKQLNGDTKPKPAREYDKIARVITSNINDKNPNLSILNLGASDGGLAVSFRKKDIAKSISAVCISKKIFTELDRLTFNAEKVYDKVVRAGICEFINHLNSSSIEPSYDLIFADRSLQYSRNFQESCAKLLSTLAPNGLVAFILPIHSSLDASLFSVKDDFFSFSKAYITDTFATLNLKQLEIINLNDNKLGSSSNNNTNASDKESSPAAQDYSEILFLFQKNAS